VKQGCLSKLILFSEASLKRVLTTYIAHYHVERNHQGKHNCQGRTENIPTGRSKKEPVKDEFTRGTGMA
jgi:hypothetical protein